MRLRPFALFSAPDGGTGAAPATPAAPPPGTTTTTTPPPPGSPPAVDRASWSAALPEDLRTALAPKNFTTPEALARSYLELEKTLGKKGIVAPEKDGDVLKWPGWKDLGVPDSYKDHGFKDPEGTEVDPALDGAFREMAGGLKLLPAQAQGLRDWWNGKQAELAAAHAAQVEDSAKAGEAALRKDFGAQLDGKLKTAADLVAGMAGETAADLWGGQEPVALLKRSPAWARALIKVADAMAEGGFGPPAGAPAIATPAAARAEITRLRGSEAYTNSRHPEHRQVQKQVADLTALAAQK
jgi:hypothetical protein